MTKDTASKLLILVVFFISCNSVKKAERIVLNDKQSSERVFRALVPDHPCANDTTILEKTDTLVSVEHYTSAYKMPKFQPFVLPHVTDTFVKTITLNRLKMGYVVDTRLLGIARDSVNYYKTALEVNKDKTYAWEKRFWVLLISLIILGFIKYKL